MTQAAKQSEPQYPMLPIKPLRSMKLKVGQYTYTINMVPTAFHHPELGDITGLFESRKQRITIAADQPIEQTREIFWHELTHAWQTQLGYHSTKYDFETTAEAFGMGMVTMDIKTLARIEEFITGKQYTVKLKPKTSTRPTRRQTA